MEYPSYIWSESQLNERMGSPYPEIQRWAVSRLFKLYPDSAETRIPSLLQSQSEDVVASTLVEMGPEVRPEHVDSLKQLYLEGSPHVSALALDVLSIWHIDEAVEWVRDKVFSGAKFSSEQIRAMITLLGIIPGEKSYELLKGTEAAIRKDRSWKWELFYSALLRHGKGQDLEVLLLTLVDQEEPDERRMAALGLILECVDPSLSVADVYYGNHPEIRRHLLNRLDYLDEITRETADPARNDPFFAELKQAIETLAVEAGEPPFAFIESSAENHAPEAGLLGEIFLQSYQLLLEGELTVEGKFGLYVMAFSVLVRHLTDRFIREPTSDAPWEERVNYVLKRPAEWEPHDPVWQTVVDLAPRDRLIPFLRDCVACEPGSWAAQHSVEILGNLKGAEAASAIIGAMATDRGESFREAALVALKKMGAAILPDLLPLLDSPDHDLCDMALNLLCDLPTTEVVEALCARSTAFLEHHGDLTLDCWQSIAAREFLPLIEQAYRPGEWNFARAALYIARVQEIDSPLIREMEKDVSEADRYAEEARSAREGKSIGIPSTLRLELLCNACAKRYHYIIKEVHVHPPGSGEDQAASADMTPYRQGFVIVDDVRCKNCQALNDFSLTPTTLAQFSAHGMTMHTMHRLGVEIPRDNPLQFVRLPGKEGKETSLVDIEREHLETVERHPGRPESHLALGKFYEYVKRYSKAKEAYLLALDMDSKAIESLAGLARLVHAEGKLADAFDWIDQCYRELGKGRIFLAEDPAEFKSTVREKRREYARDAGVRPEEEAVEIRFRVETSDYPKNRPCPCGSGKKYKLCCMKRETR